MTDTPRDVVARTVPVEVIRARLETQVAESEWRRARAREARVVEVANMRRAVAESELTLADVDDAIAEIRAKRGDTT